MAAVTPNMGVTPRKQIQAERAVEPGGVRTVLSTCRQGAREIAALLGDEIVYATIDTLRVVLWLRYQLGIDRRAYKTPLQMEREQRQRAAQPVTEPSRFAAKRA